LAVAGRFTAGVVAGTSARGTRYPASPRATGARRRASGASLRERERLEPDGHDVAEELAVVGDLEQDSVAAHEEVSGSSEICTTVLAHGSRSIASCNAREILG
jgi:hypothetical protein